MLERAYESRPQPATLLRLARCHERLGERETAAVYYRQLAGQDRDAKAQQEAGVALTRLAPSESSPEPTPTEIRASRFVRWGGIAEGVFRADVADVADVAAVAAGPTLDVGSHFETSVSAIWAGVPGIPPRSPCFCSRVQ